MALIGQLWGSRPQTMTNEPTLRTWGTAKIRRCTPPHLRNRFTISRYPRHLRSCCSEVCHHRERRLHRETGGSGTMSSFQRRGKSIQASSGGNFWQEMNVCRLDVVELVCVQERYCCTTAVERYVIHILNSWETLAGPWCMEASRSLKQLLERLIRVRAPG